MKETFGLKGDTIDAIFIIGQRLGLWRKPKHNGHSLGQVGHMLQHASSDKVRGFTCIAITAHAQVRCPVYEITANRVRTAPPAEHLRGIRCEPQMASHHYVTIASHAWSHSGHVCRRTLVLNANSQP
jgi:hypothetical protein